MMGRPNSAAFKRLRQRQAERGQHIPERVPRNENWAQIHRAANIGARIDAVRDSQLRRQRRCGY